MFVHVPIAEMNGLVRDGGDIALSALEGHSAGTGGILESRVHVYPRVTDSFEEFFHRHGQFRCNSVSVFRGVPEGGGVSRPQTPS